MVNIAKPLITSRFSATDFKKCCVLNSDVTYSTLNSEISRTTKTGGSKKTHTLMRSKKSKKY